MAIYRSQKSAWEDALLKKTTPSLLTTTTPALQDVDFSRINLTGVGKKRQHLGLAATLRHVRAEREAEEAGGWEAEEEKDELVEQEKRKKRRIEAGDDLVLGFDFDTAETVVEAAAPVRKAGGAGGAGAGGKGKTAVKAKEKKAKVAGQAFKGDKAKRAPAKEGWWMEE
jgi:hypothetical protein